MSSEKIMKIDPSLVYVCSHNGHQSMMEIFTGEELAKIVKEDTDYQILQVCQDQDMAMIFVKSALLQCMSIDPQLQNMKQDLKEIYE